MIHKIECVTLTCDNCNDDFEALFTGFTIFLDPSTAEDQARNNDWHITKDGKHYCPACYCMDDEDNIVLKEKEQTQ